MDGKVLIISSKKTNLVDSIIYKFIQEKIEYILSAKIDNNILKEKICSVILIDNLEYKPIQEYTSKNKIPVIFISNEKKTFDHTNHTVNFIITNLLDDQSNYTETQKEFLFRKDIYSIINAKVYDFVKNQDGYTNGLIIDTTECKPKYNNWVFDFDSINESYSWLARKRKTHNSNIEEKTIDYYRENIYNDSDKEIKYLIDRLKLIRKNIRATDIFILTKEELELFKKNHFFRMLINNISKTYKFYLVDKDLFVKKYKEIYDKTIYGVLIFDDCVYIDYLDNEYSLGYVDCKRETIIEYNALFDFIVNKLGKRILKESDLDEL